MNKCQRFSFVDDLGEVVPDGLYMQALVGETLSISVVSFRLPGGPGIAAKAHSHGEEASLQIRGGCTVNLGDDPQTPQGAVEMDEGVLMLMPADHPHSGVNRYDPGGMSLRLNVVTPPRAEFGAKGSAQTYYPTDAAEAGKGAA